ncbi:multidrug efflux MFS transporter [Paenibacillus jamilae]|uniref:multidrug efflux MFS transporter n=3 Tax=Paenibacillus TaxID=44249 RepID=UPI001428A95A|nr:multidrug efflux MFS transporter [Paenibacillus jamilae]
MLAYGVSEVGTSWSKASTITGLTIGGIALILFIFVELAQKQPLLELKAFKSSDFTRSIILTWIVQLALFGAMLIVPLYLQGVMHYTVLETGWILMPYALCATRSAAGCSTKSARVRSPSPVLPSYPFLYSSCPIYLWILRSELLSYASAPWVSEWASP